MVAGLTVLPLTGPYWCFSIERVESTVLGGFGLRLLLEERFNGYGL